MPRIILTADRVPSSRDAVLLAESVQSVHLSSEHGARQLIERLRWALEDAEALERAPRAVPAPSSAPHTPRGRTPAVA